MIIGMRKNWCLKKMIETYKKIKDFNGYEVSNLGNIKRVEETRYKSSHNQWKSYNCVLTIKEKQLKLSNNGRGYLQIYLRKDGKKYALYIHRLVAQAFIPNPKNKEQVNHKDGNKQNNIVDNLEWVTNLENQQHARKLKLINQDGENSWNSKMFNKDVLNIRKQKENGSSPKDIYKNYANTISYGQFMNIWNNREWKHLVFRKGSD